METKAEALADLLYERLGLDSHADMDRLIKAFEAPMRRGSPELLDPELDIYRSHMASRLPELRASLRSRQLAVLDQFLTAERIKRWPVLLDPSAHALLKDLRDLFHSLATQELALLQQEGREAHKVAAQAMFSSLSDAS